MVTELNKEVFEEKITNLDGEFNFKGDKPVVIDFWAGWCAPCKMVAPIIDELSEQHEGKVDFYKLDTDEHGELAEMFGIQSLPSILFIPVEGQPQMAVGAMPKDSFDDAIQQIFGIE